MARLVQYRVQRRIKPRVQAVALKAGLGFSPIRPRNDFLRRGQDEIKPVAIEQQCNGHTIGIRKIQHRAPAASNIGEPPHQHNCKVVRERLGKDAGENNHGFIATPTGAASELSCFEQRSTPPQAEELG